MDRAQKKLALQKTIDDQTESLKNKAEGYKNLGKDALLVGGLLVFGYTLFRLFSDEETAEEKIEESESKDSFISAGLKGLASSLLLALAKDKLTDFLASTDSDEE